MREISTKPIEDGEHVMIDGVEYVAEQHGNDCRGCAFYGGHDCDNIPCQSFIMCKVEKQPTYRPYKDTDEMIEDYLRRNGKPSDGNYVPSIWVKNNDGFITLITEFGHNHVWRSVVQQGVSMSKLFQDYTYLDGSPCGKLEDGNAQE